MRVCARLAVVCCLLGLLMPCMIRVGHLTQEVVRRDLGNLAVFSGDNGAVVVHAEHILWTVVLELSATFV